MKRVAAMVAAAFLGGAALASAIAGWWFHASAPATSSAAAPASAGALFAASAGAGSAAKFSPEFRVYASPDGVCVHGEECALHIQLVVDNDYRLNTNFPYKFAPDKSSGVEIVKRSDFLHDDETSGVLPVLFRAKSAGPVRVAGVFKLAICDDAFCRVENAPVSVDVIAE